jgi:HSP20 family protein
MSDTQPLTVREKQELAKKEEQTVPGRYFVPPADIFETDDSLTVILEVPGVEKNDITVALEEDVTAG